MLIQVTMPMFSKYGCSESDEISLYDCITKREFKQANRLLDDPSYNVNKMIFGQHPPLLICAFDAKDSKDERGNHVGDEYVQIMLRILGHPSLKRDTVASRDDCSKAMSVVCRKAQSLTAAKLLLNEDNLSLGYKDGLNEWDTSHDGMVHGMMIYMTSSNIEIAIHILREILQYPHLGDSVYDLDPYGSSILDRFICNKYIHSYDLDLTENAKRILDMLLSVKGLSTVSGKTLALAGTKCSPAAFKMLLDNGANPNDSLNGESVAHCVIARNSLLKCSYLLTSDVDLSHKWNNMNPVEMAHAYGCKREIIQVLGDVQMKDHEDGGTITNSVIPSQCTCNITMGSDGQEFHLCGWTKFKACISTKIPVHLKQIKNTSVYSRNALFAVKNNHHFMRACFSEICQMKQAIKTLFENISETFSHSSARSHLAYKYNLRGSMFDNCKCFAPNEFDAVLSISGVGSVSMNGLICPTGLSGWKRLCGDDCHLPVVAAAQEFYNEFAIECHAYNARNKDKTTGIVRLVFQFMSKISRIKLLWKGNEFTHLNVYVDIALVFSQGRKKLQESKTDLPLGLTCGYLDFIAKDDRHSYGKTFFYPSYCNAEAHIIRTLPETIRQGFITAKAARLFEVCSPELDMTHLGIVEDLNIEDYITSHALKNCLFNRLKHISESQNGSESGSDSLDGQKSIIDTYCKYGIASCIVDEFRSNMINKVMPKWCNSELPLLDCTENICEGNENICCRKRNIKLALIQNMCTWLKDEDNLRYLHDGDTCNCTDQYSKKQLDYHDAFVTRLVLTGTIDFSHCNLEEEEAKSYDSSQDNPPEKYKHMKIAIAGMLDSI